MSSNDQPCSDRKSKYLRQVLIVTSITFAVGLVLCIVGGVLPVLGGVLVAIGVLIIFASIITAAVLLSTKYRNMCRNSD